MLLNNQMVYRYVWIRNQLSCQEPFSKPSSPSKGWRCSPSWDTKPTVSNSGMNFTRVCVVCQREQTVTNTRKIDHNKSFCNLKSFCKSCQEAFTQATGLEKSAAFIALLQTQHSWSCSLQLFGLEKWNHGMLLQTSSPEALHVSRAALGSSTLCKSKQNPADITGTSAVVQRSVALNWPNQNSSNTSTDYITHIMHISSIWHPVSNQPSDRWFHWFSNFSMFNAF